MDLAWSLSSCRSMLTVLLRVTWCCNFHPKRWYETKLSGSGCSLYVFLTIAWSQSMTVSGGEERGGLAKLGWGAPADRKLGPDLIGTPPPPQWGRRPSGEPQQIVEAQRGPRVAVP